MTTLSLKVLVPCLSMAWLSSLSYPLSGVTTTDSRIVTGVNHVVYYRVSLIFTDRVIYFITGLRIFLVLLVTCSTVKILLLKQEIMHPQNQMDLVYHHRGDISTIKLHTKWGSNLVAHKYNRNDESLFRLDVIDVFWSIECPSFDLLNMIVLSVRGFCKEYGKVSCIIIWKARKTLLP